MYFTNSLDTLHQLKMFLTTDTTTATTAYAPSIFSNNILVYKLRRNYTTSINQFVILTITTAVENSESTLKNTRSQRVPSTVSSALNFGCKAVAPAHHSTLQRLTATRPEYAIIDPISSSLEDQFRTHCHCFGRH